MKCQFSQCNNEAATPSPYCAENAPKCRFAHNSEVLRRKKGQRSRKDAVAALEQRECPQCHEKFTPATFGQKYCTDEQCAKDAANAKRRTAEKPFDQREACLKMLDAATVNRYDVAYDWEVCRWLSKGEYFTTDHRHEKTKAIVKEAQRFLEQEGTMSMRFLFYHLVQTALLVNNLEQYKGLSRKISEARDRGEISTDAFTDNVRESITYQSWADTAEFKASAASAYKTDLWQSQDTIVEVWTEKDSVVSALESTVREYRVPLRVLRGQGSNSYLDTVARDLEGCDKPLRILYLGDHDPAGYVIEESARHRFYALLMEERGWNAERIAKQIQWKRIGFLHEDFKKFNVEALPEDDKEFAMDEFLARFPDGRRAELEGLTPDELRGRTRAAIEEVMGTKGLRQRKADLKREEAERKSLSTSW